VTPHADRPTYRRTADIELKSNAGGIQRNALANKNKLLNVAGYNSTFYTDFFSLCVKPAFFFTFANSSSYFYANSNFYYNSYTRAYTYFYTHTVERAIDFNCATGAKYVCGGNR